jgi:hypothetical protein
LNFFFQPPPRVPVTLMFWDEEPEDGFEPMAKLLFDETITDHLDIGNYFEIPELIGRCWFSRLQVHFEKQVSAL